MKTLRVFVYRNLHKNCFSVCDATTRRLLCHTEAVILANAKFIVRLKGRDRVLREGRKNVHAWVEGDLVIDPYEATAGYRLREVRYDPYESPDFLLDGEPITEAESVRLDGGKVYV